MAHIHFNEVLHPQFKTYYFIHHKWPQAWIDEALNLLRTVWAKTYKPVPADKPPPSSTTQEVSGSRAKKGHVNFKT
jgi:hypothetical protein